MSLYKVLRINTRSSCDRPFYPQNNLPTRHKLETRAFSTCGWHQKLLKPTRITVEQPVFASSFVGFSKRFSTLTLDDEGMLFGSLEEEMTSPEKTKEPEQQHVPLRFQIMRMIAAGDLENARNLIDSLADEGIALPAKVYCILITAYSRHSRGMDAEALQSIFLKYDEIVEKLKVELHIAFYNIMLDAMVRKNRLDYVSFWYNRAKERQLVGDNLTYGLIIRAHCLKQDSENALKAYAELRALGLRPLRPTFNFLIDMCRRKRDIATVIKLCEDMWTIGIVPNEITFNGIIDAYGRMGDIENMLKYFNMMDKYGLRPDTPIYGALINAFGKKGDFEQMLKYFEMMKAAGYNPPNRVIYNIIIDSFGRWGKVDQMVQFYEEMARLRLYPDAFTITSVIAAHAKQGNIDRMLEFVDILKRNSPKQPDFMVYNIVITAFGKQQNHQKVIEWYRAMKAAKFRPNIANYSYIITAFRTLKDKEALSQVIKELG